MVEYKDPATLEANEDNADKMFGGDEKVMRDTNSVPIFAKCWAHG